MSLFVLLTEALQIEDSAIRGKRKNDNYPVIEQKKQYLYAWLICPNSEKK